MDPSSTSISMMIAFALLVVCSGFFSATETAFTSINRIRLKTMAENGDKKAEVTLELVEDYDRLLSTILIGNNIVNIAATTIATLLFVDWLGSGSGPAMATLFVTVIVLIFGEISPKTMAKEYPEQFAMFATGLMRVLMWVCTPFNWLTAQWKKLLDKLFVRHENSGITEEELITMVSEAENEGGLDQHESELIRSAIEFNELEVEAILTHRVDIAAVEDTATMEEIGAAFAEHGYSRLPVYHDTIDTIVGVILEKDFHTANFHGRKDVSALISKVIYTTATTKISDLLRILQRAKSHMVIVVDEYGGTEGLCTMEDIVEELVGEIWDEHDEVIEEFIKQDDGSYVISCNANLTDLYELFEITGESDSNTVSGWVMESIGRVPDEGDTFTYENLDVTVTKVDHRRVMEINVVVHTKIEE